MSEQAVHHEDLLVTYACGYNGRASSITYVEENDGIYQ